MPFLSFGRNQWLSLMLRELHLLMVRKCCCLILQKLWGNCLNCSTSKSRTVLWNWILFFKKGKERNKRDFHSHIFDRFWITHNYSNIELTLNKKEDRIQWNIERFWRWQVSADDRANCDISRIFCCFKTKVFNVNVISMGETQSWKCSKAIQIVPNLALNVV